MKNLSCWKVISMVCLELTWCDLARSKILQNSFKSPVAAVLVTEQPKVSQRELRWAPASDSITGQDLRHVSAGQDLTRKHRDLRFFL